MMAICLISYVKRSQSSTMLLCIRDMRRLLYVVMRLQMFHAIFVIAVTGGTISELHGNVIILGNAADRACMNRAFSGGCINRTDKRAFPLDGRSPVPDGRYDIAAEEKEVI